MNGFFSFSRCVAATSVAVVVLSIAVVIHAAPPGEREQKVRADKARLEQDESWLYNDYAGTAAAAKSSGKPLLVVFRCIPCEACSKFDDEVVRRNETVRALMDQFVCVRIVKANGLDLRKFQFDYDQSFHAFLMNADGTIYGRFGTRSESKDETQDMTMQGFARALEQALTWHKSYPDNKARFAGKTGYAPPVGKPEDYPMLSGKYTSELNYDGNVVQSCIHCHQVREAERRFYRDAGKTIPEHVLYPHPLPKVIGLTMNSLEAAEVKAVAEGSIAAEAGLRAGDRIAKLNGSPILSIADMQHVLHQFPASGVLQAELVRGGRPTTAELTLPVGWRTKSDISWRATTWDLRRAAFGGMALEPLPDDERSKLGIAADRLALRVKHVGQYGDHAKAKQAGWVKGDVITEFAGSTAPLTETQMLAHSLANHKPGDKIRAKIRRGEKEVAMVIPVQ